MQMDRTRQHAHSTAPNALYFQAQTGIEISVQEIDIRGEIEILWTMPFKIKS